MVAVHLAHLPDISQKLVSVTLLDAGVQVVGTCETGRTSVVPPRALVLDLSVNSVRKRRPAVGAEFLQKRINYNTLTEVDLLAKAGRDLALGRRLTAVKP